MPDLVRATAPVRICDCGGWTDTWFAQRGAVLHVAVAPGVDVGLSLADGGGGEPPVTVHARSYDDTYAFTPGHGPGRHPLVEAAIGAWPPPAGTRLDVSIGSGIPPGAGTGTSAAVLVALVAALDALAGRARTALDTAREAHAIETGLGLESGIQDQIAAACGGVNFVEIAAYPDADVHPLDLAPDVRSDLESRLVLLYLGRAHDSSALHRAVIAGIRSGGSRAALDDLAAAARLARDSLSLGDLPAFGRALAANTAAQAALHPALVSAEAGRAGRLAEDAGAWGWKVNGAGGEGGSVSVLLGTDHPAAARAHLLASLRAALPAVRELRVRLAPSGVQASGSR